MTPPLRVLQNRIDHLLLRHGYRLVCLKPGEERYFRASHDARVPLPAGADQELSPDNPRLIDLQRRYRALRLPVCAHSQWTQRFVSRSVDLRYFRGDNAYVWQLREAGFDAELRFYLSTEYVEQHDPRGLLQTLGEDGQFGCWTFGFHNRPAISRDLLESILEIYFLERHLGVCSSAGSQVLDIGAGYGRLAHRLLQAAPISAYYCVDAIAESTFVCEYYLRHRGCLDRARVVALDRVDADLPRTLDLAINVHSFSEMPVAAIDWWLRLISERGVRHLMIVPNDGDRFLSMEEGRVRRDFLPLLGNYGFALKAEEPLYGDPDLQRFQRMQNRMYLFERGAHAMCAGAAP